MAIISLRNIRDALTRDRQLNSAIAILSDLGFRTTSWQPGSVQRSIITAAAWLTADAAAIVTEIAENALDTQASGGWLDVVSTFYGTTRTPATAAVGTVALSLSTGSVSYSAGELVLSASPLLGEPLFRVTESVSLSTTGNGEPVSDTFTIQAVTTGSASNVDAGPLYLVTPVEGLTATLVDDPTTGTWLTNPGTDREDDARLRLRNALRWSQLAYGANRDAYTLWALEADSSITRTNVDSDGAGNVTIYAATNEGAISSPQIATVQAYIDARHPFDDVPTVVAPATLSVPVTLAPTIVEGTSTIADIANAIDEYFGSVPIGGIVVPPSSVGQVLRDELIERIMALPGVKRAGLTLPAADVSLNANQIPVAVNTITPLLVAS